MSEIKPRQYLIIRTFSLLLEIKWFALLETMQKTNNKKIKNTLPKLKLKLHAKKHLPRQHNWSLLAGKSLSIKKNASLIDCNTMGLKWQLSHFQLQGQVTLQRKKIKRPSKFDGWYIWEKEERKRKNWWQLIHQYQASRRLILTLIGTLVSCKFKGITNACLNLVILKPTIMDINY